MLLPIISLKAAPATGSALVGQTATISVTADGTPPLNYQWKKNGVNITNATASSYVINSVLITDTGIYTVLVSNSAGSATSDNATLTVNQLPAFTTQPLSQTVVIGASVNLSVVVIGTPTPTLQWKKNGVNIAGATGLNYNIANVAATDAATYTSVATSSVGTVTSAAAVLTVNAIAPTNLNVTITVTN